MKHSIYCKITLKQRNNWKQKVENRAHHRQDKSLLPSVERAPSRPSPPTKSMALLRHHGAKVTSLTAVNNLLRPCQSPGAGDDHLVPPPRRRGNRVTSLAITVTSLVGTVTSLAAVNPVNHLQPATITSSPRVVAVHLELSAAKLQNQGNVDSK